MPAPLDPTIIPEAVRKVLTSLCMQHRVRDLALFGSVITESFDPDTSDIDILVEFGPMTPGEHMQHYFELAGKLEQFFQRNVDLVELASVRNPYILASIQKNRVDLYAAG